MEENLQKKGERNHENFVLIDDDNKWISLEEVDVFLRSLAVYISSTNTTFVLTSIAVQLILKYEKKQESLSDLIKKLSRGKKNQNNFLNANKLLLIVSCNSTGVPLQKQDGNH
eukprot:c3095_g1_i1.p1 GENE.c3095_g1_i1~~c3095_g1_i1.p1  ORF type:complete len:113 (-),score=21.14 c3095_g1_i1:352-690(-)